MRSRIIFERVDDDGMEQKKFPTDNGQTGQRSFLVESQLVSIRVGRFTSFSPYFSSPIFSLPFFRFVMPLDFGHSDSLLVPIDNSPPSTSSTFEPFFFSLKNRQRISTDQLRQCGCLCDGVDDWILVYANGELEARRDGFCCGCQSD